MIEDREALLSELLLEWEERRQGGEAVSPAQLCRDRPELIEVVAERVRALESVHSAEAVRQIAHAPQRIRVVGDPNWIPTLLDLRLRCFEKANDAAGCRATAEMWEQLGGANAESLYTAARNVLARLNSGS
jgi:hypothetical protein